MVASGPGAILTRKKLNRRLGLLIMNTNANYSLFFKDQNGEYIIPRKWESELHKKAFFRQLLQDCQMFFGHNALKFSARVNKIDYILAGMEHDCPPNINQHLINSSDDCKIRHIREAIGLYGDGKIEQGFFITIVEYAFAAMGVKLWE